MLTTYTDNISYTVSQLK